MYANHVGSCYANPDSEMSKGRSWPADPNGHHILHTFATWGCPAQNCGVATREGPIAATAQSIFIFCFKHIHKITYMYVGPSLLWVLLQVQTPMDLHIYQVYVSSILYPFLYLYFTMFRSQHIVESTANIKRKSEPEANGTEISASKFTPDVEGKAYLIQIFLEKESS
jgi:hypothetical protein